MANKTGAFRRRFGRRRGRSAPAEAPDGLPATDESGEACAEPPRREGPRRGFYLLPNSLTTMSLMLGFYSITMSFGAFINPRPGIDYFYRAAWAIFAAAIFDGLDGRVARLTKTTSSFGVQYDSLSDLVSFGLAPAALLYNFALRWGYHEFHGTGLGWVAAFLYAVCGALRLARFNVTTDKLPPGVFQGLAIPAAAVTAAFAVLFDHEMGWTTAKGVATWFWPFLILTFALSLLMVSTIYYPNFKKVDIYRRHPFGTFLFVVVMIAIVFAQPVKMIFAIMMIYAASSPLKWLAVYRKQGRRPFVQ
jgi:CDP-diacylglycerol--serine O-phosphatidyltransferase